MVTQRDAAEAFMARFAEHICTVCGANDACLVEAAKHTAERYGEDPSEVADDAVDLQLVPIEPPDAFSDPEAVVRLCPECREVFESSRGLTRDNETLREAAVRTLTTMRAESRITRSPFPVDEEGKRFSYAASDYARFGEVIAITCHCCGTNYNPFGLYEPVVGLSMAAIGARMDDLWRDHGRLGVAFRDEAEARRRERVEEATDIAALNHRPFDQLIRRLEQFDAEPEMKRWDDARRKLAAEHGIEVRP